MPQEFQAPTAPGPPTDTPVTNPLPGGRAAPESPAIRPAPMAQDSTAQLSTVLAQTSKTLPETPAPRQPILQVKLVDEKIGFRVFALRNFTKGEQLYRERIALEATHHAHTNGTRNAYERYRRLSAARRDAMHGAFPALAAANRVDAETAAASRRLIPSRLVGAAAVVDIVVTAEQHIRMRPRWPRRRRFLGRRHSDARKETLEWFARYAFRLEPSSTMSEGHSRAGVYLLTGLINHRCAGHFNCRVVTTVDGVKVVAERTISSGEELTINYQKHKRDFSCCGSCCQSRWWRPLVRVLKGAS